MFAYFFFLAAFSRWDKALPAAVLDALLVRPSRRTLDAVEAAFAEVFFLGALVWLRALPAAVFEPFPVDLLVMVFEALEAAFFPVTFLGMSGLRCFQLFNAFVCSSISCRSSFMCASRQEAVRSPVKALCKIELKRISC